MHNVSHKRLRRVPNRRPVTEKKDARQDETEWEELMTSCTM